MAGPFARLRRGGDAGDEAPTSEGTVTDAAGIDPTTDMTAILDAAAPTEAIGHAVASSGEASAETADATGDTQVLPVVRAAAGTELLPADLAPDPARSDAAAAAPADAPPDADGPAD